MKGVILAGGTGSRLSPCTKVTNKHLLPVYDKPMVFYPLETLRGAGIREILVITGAEDAGDFMKLLGSGREFGVELTYRIQDEAGGIAQALGMAENFINVDERFAVILGDNVFERGVERRIKEFERNECKARIFLKEVEDANRFGVAEVKGGRVLGIEEKPKKPKSSYAVTGLYLYDHSVFDIVKKLEPSSRGELEISDVNNEYIKRGEMGYAIVEGAWTDAGTFDSLMRACEIARESKRPSSSG